MERMIRKHNRFSFAQISSINAQCFWNATQHATAFTEPKILETLCKRVDWFLASKGDQPVCLWPVCLPDGKSPSIPDFCYYIGPVWNKHGLHIPEHRWFSDSTQIYEGFIALLVNLYGKIHAQMPLGMEDVRVFDWWNFHKPLKPRFIIKPRYTACIRNVQAMSVEQLQAGFRIKRRQLLRGILTQGGFERSDQWEDRELIKLYCSVMERQQRVVSESRLAGILALCSLVRQERGEVVAFRDNHGQIMSAGLLIYAKSVANLVLCLTSNEYRNQKVTLWTIYTMLMAGKIKGMDIIDFNGANSPLRADDKHSYGARAELFFELLYDETSGISN